MALSSYLCLFILFCYKLCGFQVEHKLLICQIGTNSPTEKKLLKRQSCVDMEKNSGVEQKKQRCKQRQCPDQVRDLPAFLSQPK